MRVCQPFQYFRLSLPANFPVAGEGRQNIFMPEVLAPCLELLGCHGVFLPELCLGASKAVRVKVWQANTVEGFPKDGSYRAGGAPVLAL